MPSSSECPKIAGTGSGTWPKRPATFANGSVAKSIGPACNANTTGSPDDGIIRKYRRSDASPVRGTIRGRCPASPDARRYRPIRSCMLTPSSVRSPSSIGPERRPDEASAIVPQDRATVGGVGWNTDAVGDDAFIERGARADVDVVPQDGSANTSGGVHLHRGAEGRLAAPCKCAGRHDVVVDGPDVPERRFGDKRSERAGSSGYQGVVEATDRTCRTSLRKIGERSSLDDLYPDEMKSLFRPARAT